MATSTNDKKYYWLKLKEGFFRDKKMKKLRRIAGGDTFTIIYLKMQLLSLRHEGKLYFEGVEDDFAEEIALEIDEDIENVQVTLAYLFKNGLIEEVAADEYILPQTIQSIGSESSSAARVRKHREKKKKEIEAPKNKEALPPPNGEVLHCNAQVTTSNTEIEKEKEKEIEKETNKQTNGEEPKEEPLSKEDQDHIELIEGLLVSWSVNNYQILYIYQLAKDQIPFEFGMAPEQYDIKVYDGLHRLTMQAKADGVENIYRWLIKMIPLTIF